MAFETLKPEFLSCFYQYYVTAKLLSRTFLLPLLFSPSFFFQREGGGEELTRNTFELSMVPANEDGDRRQNYVSPCSKKTCCSLEYGDIY
jgi:hypothetical protein